MIEATAALPGPDKEEIIDDSWADGKKEEGLGADGEDSGSASGAARQTLFSEASLMMRFGRLLKEELGPMENIIDFIT